jgi:hypothetical protein
MFWLNAINDKSAAAEKLGGESFDPSLHLASNNVTLLKTGTGRLPAMLPLHLKCGVRGLQHPIPILTIDGE